MTDYIRQQQEIHADWAYHIGLLLNQYELLCKENGLSKFKTLEVTLLISLFQSLLTNFQENHEFRKDELADLSKQTIEVWGIEKAMILKDSFRNIGLTPSIGECFEHLRHSLSHPLGTNEEVEKPFTGFSTKKCGPADLIKSVVFKHSPDIKNTKNKLRPSARIFVLELPVSILRHITIRLSSELSRSLKKNGFHDMTIKEHFARF